MERGALTALVLGAGLSRRFGRPKQLLPYRGTTLLNWVVTQAEANPAVDAVIVVLGQASEQIAASLTLRRACAVVAEDFDEGCAASYRTGLAASDPLTHGLMILPGDQPDIHPEAIERLAAAWRASDGAQAIVVARYQGVLGHPLIFDRRLFPELATLHGDKAAWKLLDRHPQSVSYVELDWPAPTNINTIEDYTALTKGAG